MAITKRKSVSKKARFEVFKRDGFTCQYCGAHPPAVILHLDHIHPVAQGGGNENDNLITSCESCNQGKSDRSLSDIPQSLQEKAALIIEKEEQIKGYKRVMEARRLRIEDECEEVVAVYERFREGFTLNDKARVTVRLFIEKLGVHEVVAAMERAYTNTKIRGGEEFKYFCGICWNKIREIE
ncbi:MAG: hypothetical protein QG572_1935 [Pseudomonadota bacterium]|nr:hypothetical protein [Pseudomonadota bacterium]